MHLDWQYLAWDCYTSFCAHMYQSYGPWFMPKFRIRSIFWEQIDGFSLNFIYALILTRSSLGLLQVIFRTFVLELWPLIYAKISFLLNILRTNWQIFTNFYIYAFILIKSRLVLLHIIFRTFVLKMICYGPWFMPDFCFRLISWEQKWQIFTKSYICIHIDKI